MKPLLLAAAFLAFSSPTHAQQPAGPAMKPAPIVFFDIAGPDLDKQRAFYRNVFGWESTERGDVKVSIGGPPLDGFLRTDPKDKVIYLGVPDIKATEAAIAANGGAIVAPRFEVKGVVILGLFTDPAGNSMGLVEIGADGLAKVP